MSALSRAAARGALCPLFAALFILSAAAPAPCGNFALTKDQGVWWITDKRAGTRFFSLGVNSVNEGREKTKVPGAPAYDASRSYLDANAFRRDALDRLAAWGFNTLGGWCDPALSPALPITPVLHLGAYAKMLFADVFDPAVAQDVKAMAATLTAPYKDNPGLIGYFTDNEVGWWHVPLFRYFLAAPPGTRTKDVLIDQLSARYFGDFAALSADFVPPPGIASFNDLRRAGASLKLRPGGRGIAAIDAFMAAYVRRNYEIIRDAVRAAHPDALILGDRFPLYYLQDAVLAMPGLVDAISTNYNVDDADGWVAPYYFEGLAGLAGLPVIVSEYYFTADDGRSGNLNSPRFLHVPTQDMRERGAKNAATALAATPNLIGAHWFQYYDEPTGGRASDGEDCNMGLVDIANAPYLGLTSMFSALNPGLDKIHAQARFTPPAAHSPATIARAEHVISVNDDALTDWDKKATRLTGFATPAPYVPFGDIHLAWRPQGLYLANFASNYIDFDILDYSGDYPLAETYQIHLLVELDGNSRHFALHLVPTPDPDQPGQLKLTATLYDYANPANPRPLPPDLAQILSRPLPHIALEAHLPAQLFGLKRLTPGTRLKCNVIATNFHRELTQSWAGKPSLGGGWTEVAGEKREAVLR